MLRQTGGVFIAEQSRVVCCVTIITRHKKHFICATTIWGFDSAFQEVEEECTKVTIMLESF